MSSLHICTDLIEVFLRTCKNMVEGYSYGTHASSEHHDIVRQLSSASIERLYRRGKSFYQKQVLIHQQNKTELDRLCESFDIRVFPVVRGFPNIRYIFLYVVFQATDQCIEDVF